MSLHLNWYPCTMMNCLYNGVSPFASLLAFRNRRLSNRVLPRLTRDLPFDRIWNRRQDLCKYGRVYTYVGDLWENLNSVQDNSGRKTANLASAERKIALLIKTEKNLIASS